MLARDPRGEIMMRRHLCVITAEFGFFLPAVLVCAWLGTSFAQQKGKPPALRVEPGANKRGAGAYDPDPKHLWNRLHQALHVRLTDNRGGEEQLLEPEDRAFALDELDPFLWHHARYLLDGPGHKPALAVLDEFLKGHGEKLVANPLKKALLQRDLWAVFDWCARPAWETYTKKRDQFRTQRRALATRLAPIIRRLALTAVQIQELGDNYADALAAKNFPAEFDAKNPDKPFLPRDIWHTKGPWVLLGDRGSRPLAQTHVQFFGGRSAFFVFLRLPGGREETVNYLKWALQGRTSLANTPQFPAGTQVALVRQALLINDKGDIAPTRLTEAVQFRVFANPREAFWNVRAKPAPQRFFEIKLKRTALLSGKAGGLQALGSADGERAFLLFMGGNAGEGRERVLGSCRECHSNAGIQSVNSYTHVFADGFRGGPVAYERAAETDRIVRWKRERFDWGLLQGLTEQRPGK
jgi:hypothetical protein